MSFTLVSGLFDIGRGEWGHLQRDFSKYLEYFSFILKLDCNMCIFIEEKYYSFVKEKRKEFETKTKIYTIKIENLLMWNYKQKIENIMNDEFYKSKQKDTKCPEVSNPLYNIIVNSKVELIYKSFIDNPFNTDFFIWMDSGYGHGTIDIPHKYKYNPVKLMKENKISILCLQDVKLIPKDYWNFFEQHEDIITGGCWCIHSSLIETYKNIFYTTLNTCIEKGITDDDQYITSMIYIFNNDLFFPFYSNDWYIGLKM